MWQAICCQRAPYSALFYRFRGHAYRFRARAPKSIAAAPIRSAAKAVDAREGRDPNQVGPSPPASPTEKSELSPKT